MGKEMTIRLGCCEGRGGKGREGGGIVRWRLVGCRREREQVVGLRTSFSLLSSRLQFLFRLGGEADIKL